MAIAVVLLAACSSHSAANASLANLTFGEYLRIYGKQYDDPREYTQREAAFIKAMATIAQHNAEFNTSWKMGVSEHTDLLSHEFKAMSSGRHAALAATLAAARPTHDAPQFAPRDLPTQVDWRDKKVLTRVKNQGSCGSCWAFSTVESIESAVALASGTLLQLSPQQLVDCVVNSKHCGGTGGCEGATQSLGFEYVATHGLAGIDAYPYGGRDGHCHYDNRSMHAVGITGWVQLPTNNYTSLLHAVATVGPISVSVDASSWQHYAQGVFGQGSHSLRTHHRIRALCSMYRVHRVRPSSTGL